MVLPASDLALPCSHAQEADVDSELLTMEEPRMLLKKKSLQKEKQISVDPISLKESHLVLPAPKANGMSFPPALLRAKPKFLSSSLPSSATSSPRFGSTILKKKKWKNQGEAINSLARQHSEALTNLSRLRESRLRRSKSYGEGRACAPSDDFDMWLNTSNGHCSSPCKSKTEAKIKMKMDEPKEKEKEKEMEMEMEACDEKFKCGALCLFLPGFGKGKPVRAIRKEMVEHGAPVLVSRTVSLEKFECGSWTSSSAIMNDDGDSGNLYFDLPLELIRTSVNDAHSPVTAAFVFDKDQKGGGGGGGGGGGVLKKKNSMTMTTTTTRKSHESSSSSRHVRFSPTRTSSSTSYPASPSSCITPRLRKAREDFNAFLEAQSA